jgi:hypothetical protein
VPGLLVAGPNVGGTSDAGAIAQQPCEIAVAMPVPDRQWFYTKRFGRQRIRDVPKVHPGQTSGCSAAAMLVKIIAIHADRRRMQPIEEILDSRPVGDRRGSANRRENWRGGRRDSDWLCRPPDVLTPMSQAPSVGWWQWLSSCAIDAVQRTR